MALTFFGANGTQLWLTDGSSGGTHLVTDMGVQFLTYINTVNGVAFFTVETGGMIQIWRSDGTAAGTFAVSGDLNALVNPQDTAVLDGQLYFVASDMVHGSGLYRTGGGAGDAEFLASARPGYGLPPLIATASQVFYFGVDSNGVELWATDGTQAGTVRLSDTQYEPQGDLVRFGESVVFLPYVGSPSPQPGPWISDGTLAGTHALFPGVTNPFSSYSIREANGLIYAVTSQFNPELGRSVDTLYSSSGEVGAVPATVTLPGHLMNLSVLGGSLYAVSYTNSGPQIGRVDGTTYTPIQDFGGGGMSTAFGIGDRLLLLGLGSSGYGYYSFDGTSTHFVIGGFDPSALRDFTVVDGTLYFVLNTGTDSFLMVDDGTHPTHAIYATAQGNLSQIADIHAAPGGVIFSAFRADVGQELFFTNGTGISATLLNELAPGLDHSTSASIGWTGALPDGRFLFAYDDLTHGQEPWVSNGTVGGTQLLQDLAPGVAHSMLTAPMVFGGWTYYVAQNAALPHLFATNGTTTVDLGAASGNFFNNAVEYAGKLYFFFGPDVLAISPAAGTPAATDVARIAAPGSNWFPFEALVGGKLLISGFDGVWSFNGTTFTKLASGFGGGEVVGNGTVAYFANGQ
jgi:ELWxxDGT repeat protein